MSLEEIADLFWPGRDAFGQTGVLLHDALREDPVLPPGDWVSLGVVVSSQAGTSDCQRGHFSVIKLMKVGGFVQLGYHDGQQGDPVGSFEDICEANMATQVYFVGSLDVQGCLWTDDFVVNVTREHYCGVVVATQEGQICPLNAAYIVLAGAQGLMQLLTLSGCLSAPTGPKQLPMLAMQNVLAASCCGDVTSWLTLRGEMLTIFEECVRMPGQEAELYKHTKAASAVTVLESSLMLLCGSLVQQDWHPSQLPIGYANDGQVHRCLLTKLAKKGAVLPRSCIVPVMEAAVLADAGALCTSFTAVREFSGDAGGGLSSSNGEAMCRSVGTGQYRLVTLCRWV